MQKYTLASEQKVVNGVTLRRIYAVTDFYALKPYDEDADFDEFEYELIKKGTFGGWVESERNLSHEAFAWIAGEACVYGDAVVRDGALVYPFAQPYRDFDGGEPTNEQKAFARWVNTRPVYKSYTWETYNALRRKK